MPIGVCSLCWPRGLSLRIRTYSSGSMEASLRPRILPPRSLMSVMRTGWPSCIRCFPGHLVRVSGPQHHILVVWRQGEAARAVNGPGLVPGDDIENAPFAEQLADGGTEGREQDTDGAAFPQGHLHGFRNTQADAVGRFQHKLAQQLCQRTGMDILHGDRPLLGAGHRLFGDKQYIPRLHMGPRVLHRHISDAVHIGDDVGFDAQAAVLAAVHSDDLIFAGIDNGFNIGLTHNQKAPICRGAAWKITGFCRLLFSPEPAAGRRLWPRRRTTGPQ